MLPNDNIYCVAQNCRLMNLLSEYDPLSKQYENVVMKHLLNLQLALTMFNFHLINCELDRKNFSRSLCTARERCVSLCNVYASYSCQYCSSTSYCCLYTSWT